MTELLTERCSLTHEQEVIGKCWRDSDWYRRDDNASWRLHESCQQVTIAGVKVNLMARNPNLYKTWAEIVRASESKPRQPLIVTAPLPNFIDEIRIGSHQEWHEGFNGHKGFHSIVVDYRKVYRDCLVPKAWLEKHAQDHRDYIPTIEIEVNGETLSVNGNYKAGMIKEFVSKHKPSKRNAKRT